MTDHVFVIKNRGLRCKLCPQVHDYITGQSDRGCSVPIGFSKEKALKLAGDMGFPEDNVMPVPDVELVLLDDSARKLPKGGTRILLAQEVIQPIA